MRMLLGPPVVPSTAKFAKKTTDKYYKFTKKKITTTREKNMDYYS